MPRHVRAREVWLNMKVGEKRQTTCQGQMHQLQESTEGFKQRIRDTAAFNGIPRQAGLARRKE